MSQFVADLGEFQRLAGRLGAQVVVVILHEFGGGAIETVGRGP